jgi:hypothetical protein
MSGFNNLSKRLVVKLHSKKEPKSSKSNLLRARKTSYNFDSNNTIEFGRKLGSKDKKKRKIIDNGPRADGQAPMNEIGQQRTGYKYYRRRRALGFLGATSALGATIGGTIGASSTKWGAGKVNKNAVVGGALLGAGLAGGSSLLEHASNKHSPFYQKKLFGKKKK